MNEHTPGPWAYREVSGGEYWEITRHGDAVAFLEAFPPHSEANARLIAAAPDLLAAVQTYVKEHNAKCRKAGGARCECSHCAAFRVAIAKARGEQS